MRWLFVGIACVLSGSTAYAYTAHRYATHPKKPTPYTHPLPLHAHQTAARQRTHTRNKFATSPHIAGCPIFPENNWWNRDISKLPVNSLSNAYIASINAGGNQFLHADFGGHGIYGIPYNVVGPNQKRVPIKFTAYGDQSNPGPYPIPPNASVENGSDRHVLVLQSGKCMLFELYHARRQGSGWAADSGAIFNLRTNHLRPKGWTSADAAGLPILPGLVRYDELKRGVINHALRVTVENTQRGFITPARHFASSSNNPNLPPMGLRLRLKASYDIGGFHGEARVILVALKRYGLIIADNGTSWFITGASDPRFSDQDLDQLKRVPGTAFEAVNSGPIQH